MFYCCRRCCYPFPLHLHTGLLSLYFLVSTDFDRLEFRPFLPARKYTNWIALHISNFATDTAHTQTRERAKHSLLTKRTRQTAFRWLYRTCTKLVRKDWQIGNRIAWVNSCAWLPLARSTHFNRTQRTKPQIDCKLPVQFHIGSHLWSRSRVHRFYTTKNAYLPLTEQQTKCGMHKSVRVVKEMDGTKMRINWMRQGYAIGIYKLSGQ